MNRIFLIITGLMFYGIICHAQVTTSTPAPKTDLSKDPVLYTVGYAHLDTEWRWDYETTVKEYLKNTLDDNFKRFEKFPEYVFTFSGARRYLMMKEYYPDRYERLKKYVGQKRWFVGGSSVDECDANIPSPESVIRQVLYGNGYFDREFGMRSVDFLLPDCFGFQAHLPSALAHAGLKGFSTQKLSWGSANGIPFNIGNWTGPDGKGIVAALNATDYTGRIKPRLDTSSYWAGRIMENGKKYGVYADFRYYGVGDVGGAPREEDVKNAVASLNQPDSRFRVYLSSSDQLFRDLSPELAAKLPVYSGDLLLTEHSAGSLTSQAYMKRWNRKNEQLAGAAESAAVTAAWLGGLSYPSRTLHDAWWLVLGSQMHDILPGTSIPLAYEHAWNDEVLALNGFASVLEASAGAIARAMNTQVTGTALVIYNPLNIQRTDMVEAEVLFADDIPDHFRLLNEAGIEIPYQLKEKTKDRVKILFQATVPSMGWVCYDLQPTKDKKSWKAALSASTAGLENEFLRIAISRDGDITSVFDKKLGKEMLSGPVRLQFLHEHPEYWPAWNMDWKDRKNPPIDSVKGPAVITVVEKGPVRASVRIERSARNSTFVQYLDLPAGSDHLAVRNQIAWQSKGVSLKVNFPLAASAKTATYNLGLGTIERGNNEPKKFEVPSREWFDLTDKSGTFGISILEDSKFGSDKPDDKTLRLTLLHTPVTNFYHDQATQDWGLHEVTFTIAPHKGDWRTGATGWKARRLNQPLRVFQCAPHPGFLGKSFSFLNIPAQNIEVVTLKKAENGKEIILRIQETTGKESTDFEIGFAGKILRAFETDGQEQLIGDVLIQKGKLSGKLKKYEIKSYTLQLDPPAEKLQEPVSTRLPLPYDLDVVSSDKNRKNGSFDRSGTSIPAELLPDQLSADGITFYLGPKSDGLNNALRCTGQKITLPKTGNYNRLYILASATTDTTAVFRLGNAKIPLQIQGWSGRIGQFDNRVWDKYGRIKGIDRGFIRRDNVAWFATHLHRDSVNLPYQYAYIYKYALDAGPGSGFLQLPENSEIRIFAITLAQNAHDQISVASPLYDDFSARPAMNLTLPQSDVTESMVPSATMKFTRNRKLTDLPARLTMKDYADIHQPNGVTVRYFFTGAGTDSVWPGQSGGENPITSGMTVTAINDGMYELLPGDTLNDQWTMTGKGRILMDLQREIEIDSIHIFTVQNTGQGGQSFSLWGASGANPPEFNRNPASSGWKFMLLAPPQDIWGNSKALYSVYPDKSQPCNYRYLLWISEDSKHGPVYFREVDVFEKQK